MSDLVPTKPRPDALDKPIVKRIIRWVSRTHVFIYRATGGILVYKLRAGSAFPWGLPVCLLTTTGRKSGKQRISPLLFLPEGDSVLIVASVGGLPKNPAWFHNIKANPEVKLQIRWRKRTMKARIATPEEREEYWPKLVAHYNDFASHQSWTKRTIPVVVLDPV